MESELADSLTDPAAKAAMRTNRADSIPPQSIAEAVSYAGRPVWTSTRSSSVRPGSGDRVLAPWPEVKALAVPAIETSSFKVAAGTRKDWSAGQTPSSSAEVAGRPSGGGSGRSGRRPRSGADEAMG
ncbi:hypothetical protein [Nonomuraea polychroma]|uniref:hypothetical protein n=1 Tax=Nonomuraea polychroma TaxID=46176 RepID=UPI001F4E9003|nr:hypothetical protein [Nonomuraea polychroma]